jgi:hypothetical protein
MPEPTGFPSLKVFVGSIQSAKFSDYSSKVASMVAHEAAFAEMKAHILNLYDKTEVQHSFVDESGAVFDCIPIEQQLSLRGSTGAIPKAPDLPKVMAGGGPQDERKDAVIASPLGPDRKDRHGNVMQCPLGTVPIRRVTLEDLTRFGTLQDFFQKGPRGAGRPPRAIEPATVPATHRWAHAYQSVNNGGGHSYLNLWAPSMGANQIFSLSQHWYVGGSGANLQTLECGWQVYPAMYGDTKPHLFTYWTADNYNKTGCYNVTCSAFVQIGSSFAPGMVLGPTSVSGGSQYIIELAYWHTGGRWWLYFNGTAGGNVIGYYPDTLYKGGALASQASEIDYGGEVVGTTSFPRAWPPQGAGKFFAASSSTRTQSLPRPLDGGVNWRPSDFAKSSMCVAVPSRGSYQ